MTIENSNEIEKMFNKDNSNMKRVGRGVFNRAGKGSDKAKVRGDLKGKSKFDKPYTKNSKVQSKNVYEDVLSIDYFQTFSIEQQQDLLYAWRLRYTNIYIYSEMGINENKYYQMVNNLDIEKKGEPMRVNEETLGKYKEGNIKKHEFDLLPDSQKFEVVNYMQQKGLTNKDVANILEYNPNTFNVKKSEWRRLYKEGGGEGMTDYDDGFLIDDDHKPVNKNPDQKVEEKVKHSDSEIINTSGDNINVDNLFKISINGHLEGNKVKEKTEALGILIDENKKYKVSFTIEEVE